MTVAATNAYLVELDRLLSEPLSSVRERENSAFDTLLAGCENRLVLFGAGNRGAKFCNAYAALGWSRWPLPTTEWEEKGEQKQIGGETKKGEERRKEKKKREEERTGEKERTGEQA